MKVLNGLDGKSVLIGALVVGAIVATQGSMVPLLLIGGLLYVVANKAGWWENGAGRAPNSARHRGPGGPPFLAEWHRQAHAADASSQGEIGQPAASQPTAAATAPTAPPEAEVRIPITRAPTAPVEPDAASAPAAPETDDHRPIGGFGTPPA